MGVEAVLFERTDDEGEEHIVDFAESLVRHDFRPTQSEDQLAKLNFLNTMGGVIGTDG